MIPLVNFHVYRTGGYTLRHLMEAEYGELEVLDYIEGKPCSVHMAFRHIPAGKTSSFLRQPLLRLISQYRYIYHLAGDGKAFYEQYGYRQEMSFAEFCQLDWAQLDNGMTRQLAGIDFQWGPKRDPVDDRVLELALGNLWRLDVVGLTEYYDESVRRIALACGWQQPLPKEAPVLNTVSPIKGLDFDLSHVPESINYDTRLYEYAKRKFGYD